jgi:2-dehydropantoate 2-reductase
VLHLNDVHSLSFGSRNGARPPSIEAVGAALSNSGFDARLSGAILQEMWEKWVFIATAAGITCLMRAPVGDIVAAGAAPLAGELLDECAAIAACRGYPPNDTTIQRSRGLFSTPGSPFAASMLRDIERGAPTEADHIVGDLLRRAERPEASSLLRVAYRHLKAYEARRVRESAGASKA